MSDIDFDELDRAVTSLMQKRAEKEAAQQARGADTATVTPSPTAAVETIPDTSSTTLTSQPSQSVVNVSQPEVAEPANDSVSRPELVGRDNPSSVPSTPSSTSVGATPRPVERSASIQSSSVTIPPSSSIAPVAPASPTPQPTVKPSASIPPLVIKPLVSASTVPAPPPTSAATSEPKTPSPTPSDASSVSAAPVASPTPPAVPIAVVKPEPKPALKLTLEPVPSFKTAPTATSLSPVSTSETAARPMTSESDNEARDEASISSQKPLNQPTQSTPEANGFPHAAADTKPAIVFPVTETTKKKAANQVVSESSSSKPADVSATTKPADDPSDIKHDGEPVVAPSPAISRRPSGRFMDVVHPSSVMRGHTVHQPRTGVTLQPTDSYLSGQSNNGQQGVNMTEDAEATSNNLMGDDNVPRSPVADHEIKRRPPRLVVQPDPSHVAAGLTSDNVSLNSKDVPDYESMASEAEASTDSAFIEEGLLAEDVSAKTVESEGLTMDELTADDDHLVTDDAAESQPTDGALVEHNDQATDDTVTDRASLEATIDEIEAGEVGEQPDKDAAAVNSSVQKSPDDASELDSELMAIESMDEGEDSVADEIPRQSQVPGDIPQQYTTSDDVAPDPEPMFDAAASQPATGEVLQPDKKKSGIGTILLIILFALIGVGGGAAAYFFLLYYK